MRKLFDRTLFSSPFFTPQGSVLKKVTKKCCRTKRGHPLKDSILKHLKMADATSFQVPRCIQNAQKKCELHYARCFNLVCESAILGLLFGNKHVSSQEKYMRLFWQFQVLLSKWVPMQPTKVFPPSSVFTIVLFRKLVNIAKIVCCAQCFQLYQIESLNLRCIKG